jgi:hypothetical protein
VIRATLQYTLDEAGEIAVNGRNVFLKAPGSGSRDGTVTLPVDLFAPGKTFLLRVTARKAMRPGGTPAGKVFGKATVHLATTEPLPGVDIGVSPPVLSRGRSAYLSWSSINATAVTINPIIGPVALKGTMSVAPTETTTYTITGISASGEPARASVTLGVH